MLCTQSRSQLAGIDCHNFTLPCFLWSAHHNLWVVVVVVMVVVVMVVLLVVMVVVVPSTREDNNTLAKVRHTDSSSDPVKQ